MDLIDVAFTEVYLITFTGFLIFDGIFNGSTDFSVLQFWSLHSLFYLITITLLGHIILRVFQDTSRLNEMPQTYCFLSFATLIIFSCILVDAQDNRVSILGIPVNAQDLGYTITGGGKKYKSNLLLMLYGGSEAGNFTTFGVIYSAVVFGFVFVTFFLSLYLTLSIRGEQNSSISIFSFENLLALSVFLSSVTGNVTQVQLAHCQWDWGTNIGFVILIILIYGLNTLVDELVGKFDIASGDKTKNFIKLFTKIFQMIVCLSYILVQAFVSGPMPIFSFIVSIVLWIIDVFIAIYEFFVPDDREKAEIKKSGTNPSQNQNVTPEITDNQQPVVQDKQKLNNHNELWVLRERKKGDR